MKNEIMDNLLQFITHNFQVEREEINLEESLIDEGIIDSLGLIEISTFIEKEFSIRIDVDDHNPDNFGSAVKIVDFICSRI